MKTIVSMSVYVWMFKMKIQFLLTSQNVDEFLGVGGRCRWLLSLFVDSKNWSGLSLLLSLVLLVDCCSTVCRSLIACSKSNDASEGDEDMDEDDDDSIDGVEDADAEDEVDGSRGVNENVCKLATVVSSEFNTGFTW